MMNICAFCGGKHLDSENCPDGSMLFFQCKDCGIHQMLPADAAMIAGLDGITCRCGSRANDAWKQIDGPAYRMLDLKEQLEKAS